MSTVFLIRHGQASFGSDQYDHLSPTGHRQAELLARHFAALNLVFDAVYCGSLDRQRDTVKPLYRMDNDHRVACPEPVYTDRFDEYDSRAVWEHYLPILQRQKPHLSDDIKQLPADKKAFQRLFEAVMIAWISKPEPARGLPVWGDFVKRVRSGLQTIIREQGRGKKVAVFTSGGPIAVIVQQALNLTDADTLGLSWQIMNAAVTRIQYNGRQLTLQVFNDVTHLELMKDRTLLTYR